MNKKLIIKLQSNSQLDLIEKDSGGMFIEYSVYLLNSELAKVFIKPKSGWNQFHLSIKPKYQRKGYGSKIIELVANELGYLSIQEGRIINDGVYKVIDKLDNTKVDIYRSIYDEYVITRKNYGVPKPFKDTIK